MTVETSRATVAILGARQVGIGELCISTGTPPVVTAPNLGSCLGVAVFDPVARIGGVIHCLLPLSSADPARAATEPALYVDTGVALLLEQLFQRGAQKKNLAIAAAGAGNINDERNVFEIGRKNHTVFRKLMWKNGLLVRAEHVGNPHSTTLVLDLEAGTAFAKTSTGIHPLFEEGRR